MTAVERELAQKIKLEDRLKPKLRRFFDQIGNDVNAIWIATQSIPNLNSFGIELTAILRDHYRAVSRVFKDTTRSELKSGFLVLNIKQEDNIDRQIVEYINSHSEEQSGEILRTTERNLQNIANDVITASALAGVVLSTRETGSQIQSQFNANSDSRVNTISMTETQTVSETVKLLEASNINNVIEETGQRRQMFKTWNTMLDTRTRASHVEADRQRVRADSPFIVQGQMLKVPGDTSLGATLDNIINCRCSAIFNFDSEDNDPLDTPRQ